MQPLDFNKFKLWYVKNNLHIIEPPHCRVLYRVLKFELLSLFGRLEKCTKQPTMGETEWELRQCIKMLLIVFSCTSLQSWLLRNDTRYQSQLGRYMMGRQNSNTFLFDDLFYNEKSFLPANVYIGRLSIFWTLTSTSCDMLRTTYTF